MRLLVAIALSIVCVPALVPAACTSCCSSTCADARLDPGEVCDDGNLDDADGCSSICTTPLFLDERYGDHGRSRGNFFGGDGVFDAGVDVRDAVLLPDGTIVLVGIAQVQPESTILLDQRVAVARVGTDGVQLYSAATSIAAGFDGAYGVVVDGQGDLVVAGVSNQSGSEDVALLRYAAVDGHLDASFGMAATGWVTTDLENGSTERALAIARQDDGKLVVAGFIESGGDKDILVARYTSDGVLDTTFGAPLGWVRTDVGAREEAWGVAIQDDRRIVVVGSTETDPVADAADIVIARYTDTGQPDASFGGGTGRVVRNVGTRDDAYDVQIDAFDRIVVVGRVREPQAFTSQVLLLRLTPSGAPDAGFGDGGDGMVTAPVDGDPLAADDIGQDVHVLPHGPILVGGRGRSVGVPSHDYALLRFGAAGALDERFGLPFLGDADGGDDFGQSVLVNSEGQIFLAGTTNVFGGFGAALVLRLQLDDCGNGRVDPASESCDAGSGNGTQGACCTAACDTVVDGSPCDDGDAATVMDACAAGSCVGPTTTTSTSPTTSTSATMATSTTTSTTTSSTSFTLPTTSTTLAAATCAVRCDGANGSSFNRCLKACRTSCRRSCVAAARSCVAVCSKGKAGKPCRRACRTSRAGCRDGCR